MSENESNIKNQYIGDIAKVFGVSTRSIRYYEELGLIVPERSVGGFRAYSASQVEKLGTILKLKKLGLSLEEVKKITDIKNTICSKESIKSTLAYLHDRLHKFEEKIRDYENGVNEINKLIEFINHCWACGKHVKDFKCEQCVENRKMNSEFMKTLF